MRSRDNKDIRDTKNIAATRAFLVLDVLDVLVFDFCRADL